MRKCVLGSLIVLSASVSIALADTNYSYQPIQTQTINNKYIQQPLQYAQNNLLQGNVTMVPAGTTVNARLVSPLSSQYATVGEVVTMTLNDDFYYNNCLVAQAGSTLSGTVIEASKAKRGSVNGRLCVRFTKIYTPYGSQIPISAIIRTNDNSGVLVGGTKIDVAKEYTKDLAAGSAAGALSGVVFGALAGGDVGKGAALGTAVGAGGGLVKSIWDKGNDVEIPANASVDLVFLQPITISAN